MGCDVNVEQWQKNNRVTLHRGKVNTWVLARTLRDRPDTEVIEDTARAVMSKWFYGMPLDHLYGDAGYAVDAVKVVASGPHRPPPMPGAQLRSKLDTIPLLRPEGGVAYVTLTFNYRGYDTSMPWPVYTSNWSFTREGKSCPIECDWMLLAASNPKADDPLPEAPEEMSILDKLDVYADGNVLGDAYDLLSTVTKIAGLAAGVFVAVQVVRIARPMLAARAASDARGRAKSDDTKTPSRTTAWAQSGKAAATRLSDKLSAAIDSTQAEQP